MTNKKRTCGFTAVLLCALVSLAAFAGAVIPASPLQSDDEQAIGRGKLVFEKSGCFVCHGNEGSGGVRNRNLVTGELIPKLTYISRGYTVQALRERVMRGSTEVKKLNPKSFTPPVSMPSFRGRVSEEELNDLAAYLKSLTPEEGEEPKPVSQERPPVPEYMLAGDSCQICHRIVAEKFRTNVHGLVHTSQQGNSVRYVCVTCHGDGREHAKQYGDPSALILFIKEASTTLEQKNSQCLQCHLQGNQSYWNGSTHEARNIACVDCHTLMEPASPRSLLSRNSEIETCFDCHPQRRAQIQRSSHMPVREGKVACSDCHNSHGTPNDKLLIDATVNDNCYRCHAEKRGPFLWEHPPVAENCLNCHEPHGSNHDALLTMDQPRLCQRCHAAGDVHVSTPQLTSTRYVFNRSCLNCHSQIHGSNSPSGAQFIR